MMKLASALALVAALGCGSKSKDHDKQDDKTTMVQPKPVDDKASNPAKADDKASTPVKVDDKASGDLPAECGEWKDAIAKLASCDKLGAQTRDTLKQAYDAAAAGWANVPAEGKPAVAAACKAGVDAVKQAAAACAQ